MSKARLSQFVVHDSNRARRSSLGAAELPPLVAVVDVAVPVVALPVLLSSGGSRYDRSSMGSTTLSGNSYKEKIIKVHDL